jgi:hypothetical protein
MWPPMYGGQERGHGRPQVPWRGRTKRPLGAAKSRWNKEYPAAPRRMDDPSATKGTDHPSLSPAPKASWPAARDPPPEMRHGIFEAPREHSRSPVDHRAPNPAGAYAPVVFVSAHAHPFARHQRLQQPVSAFRHRTQRWMISE